MWFRRPGPGRPSVAVARVGQRSSRVRGPRNTTRDHAGAPWYPDDMSKCTKLRSSVLSFGMMVAACGGTPRGARALRHETADAPGPATTPAPPCHAKQLVELDALVAPETKGTFGFECIALRGAEAAAVERAYGVPVRPHGGAAYLVGNGDRDLVRTSAGEPRRGAWSLIVSAEHGRVVHAELLVLAPPSQLAALVEQKLGQAEHAMWNHWTWDGGRVRVELVETRVGNYSQLVLDATPPKPPLPDTGERFELPVGH